MKNNRLIYLLLSILTIWLVIVSFSLANARQSKPTQNIDEYNVSGFSTDFTKVVDENRSAIVTINADNNISTGFAYHQNDSKIYILTTYHGVANTNNINVILASTYNTNATLLGYDYLCDLAVLTIECPYQIKTLKLGDSSILRPGEFVISIGTPLSIDYASSVQLGMISKANIAIDNTIVYNGENHNYYLDVVELSSNLHNGYSGSPIINMNGDVVGMNTMDFESELNFALTANEIKKVADMIINNQEVHKNIFGVKGVYVKDMPNYEKTNLNLDIEVIEGLYVQRVKENSIALQAGVRTGDVITKINDVVIASLDNYLDAAYMETDAITFEVIRNGQILSLGTSND